MKPLTCLFLFIAPVMVVYAQKKHHSGNSNTTQSGPGKKPPVVESINRQAPSNERTNAKEVTFRVAFSEQVTGVDAKDFTITILAGNINGVLEANAAKPANGSQKIYDVTIRSIVGEGQLRLDLKSNGTGIEDDDDNAIAGGFTSGQSYNIKQSLPTLPAVTIASNNAIASLAKPGDKITLKFTASEEIKMPVVTIALHTVTATAGNGNTFTCSYNMVNGDASGVVPFTIRYTNTFGAQGIPISATTNASSVTYDKKKPLVVSIDRKSPSVETTHDASVTFRIIFSERVNGLDASDCVPAINGTVSGVLASDALTGIGNEGTTYAVTVSAITGDGVLGLNLKASGTGITDVAGNNISDGFTQGQSYTIDQPGFASVTPLVPLNVSQPTKDKPQSKVWNYANKWWCALSVAEGTKVFRLDGTSWVDILTLNNKTSRSDCRIVGDLVHLLLYKGASNISSVYSLKYDGVAGTYALWNERPTPSDIIFPEGSETATLVIDQAERMWVASDGLSDISVWFSDKPYTTWSAPITIASGVKDDDICALVAIPNQGKIGIFWSNQITKRFGFKTHADGSDPLVWSADELPASQSANDNVGLGMADDHMNLKVSADGTIYCAAKTSYNIDGQPKLILLIRRPSGVWDDQYTVAMNPEGTQPIVVLNEEQHKIKIVYASLENGGDILYRESSTDNISFTPAMNLISNIGTLYDYSTSCQQGYSSELVIMATNLSVIPNQAVGVIASDNVLTVSNKTIANAINWLPLQLDNSQSTFRANPNPFSFNTTVRFTTPESGTYHLTLYNSSGIKQTIYKKGWAEAGVENVVTLSGNALQNGVYFIRLQTAKGSQILKVLLQK
jgi:hypothetical protein